MMINAWKLMGDATRKPAWTNLSNKDLYKEGFSVASTAPFGVSSQPTNYATNLRPEPVKNPYTTKNMPPAGGTSWPIKTDGTITGNKKAENP